MSTEILYFTLGSLFAYSISFNTYLVLKILSFTIFFYFTFTQIHKIVLPINLHKTCVFLVFTAIEHRISSLFLRITCLKRLGAILMLIGYLFSMYAAIYLKVKDGKYQHTGPYFYMRHPCYCGIIVYVCGCIMFIGQFVSFIFCVFLFKEEVGELIEKEEEDIMKEDVGYKKYRNVVKMFWIV